MIGISKESVGWWNHKVLLNELLRISRCNQQHIVDILFYTQELTLQMAFIIVFKLQMDIDGTHHLHSVRIRGLQ